VGLAQEIAKRAYQMPRVTVQVGGRAIPRIESLEVDAGYDQQTGTAVIGVGGAAPSWVDFRQKVQIWTGYGAFQRVVFTGWIQDVNRTWAPGRYEIRAAGLLAATLFQGPDDRSWSSTVDTDLVMQLLQRSGLQGDPGQILGDGLVLGTLKPIALSERQASTELIQRLDQAQGYATFDLADGTVRRQLILTVPSATGALRFVEGMNDPAAAVPTHYILAITNPQTVRGIHTKVVVTGMPLADGTTPRAAYEGSSPYAPVDQVFETSSDLLETDAACATLAERLLADQNRVITEVSMQVAGNPYLMPGMTITITAPSAGIAPATPFFVVHLRHAYSSSEGYTSEVLLYGGASGTGYRTELRPVAAFTYQVTSESFDVGAGQTAYLTVVCDAGTSYDPDTPFEQLTFAWTSGGDPATGTGVRYQFRATPDALSAGVDVTLTVSDGTSEDVLTQTITAGTAPVALRELYVAAWGAMDASPDGGATWHRQDYGGSFPVRATAPISPPGVGFFGAQNFLAMTTDFLATMPVEVHAFTGQVWAIWSHETIASRLLVGLDNGEVWLTTNVDLGATATWRKLPHTFADPVLAIAESFDRLGLIRVASGTNIWISYDQLETASVLVPFGGTTRAIALSFAGNYFAASAAGGPVKGESGDTFTFPAVSPAVADVRGLTTHIRDQVVYAADRQGRTWIAAGGSTFVAGGVLGAGDPANHLLRDGDYQDVLYAAADDAVYKSYDGARSWHPLRALTGTVGLLPLTGMAVGYGGATLGTLAPIVIASSMLDKAAPGGGPGGWTLLDFDDSSYPNAVEQRSGQGWARVQYGTEEGGFVRAHANEGNALRRVFPLVAGRITGGTLELSLWNHGYSWTINNHRVGFPPLPSGGITPPPDSIYNSTIRRDYTFTVPPEWLVAGADNVFTLAFANGSAVYGLDAEPPGYPPGNDGKMGAVWRLTING
jgi:hypothetical protein